jgi:hypothetical protein
MSRRNRPGRPRAQPRDVEVTAVPQDDEGQAGPMAVEVVLIDRTPDVVVNLDNLYCQCKF